MLSFYPYLKNTLIIAFLFCCILLVDDTFAENGKLDSRNIARNMLVGELNSHELLLDRMKQRQNKYPTDSTIAIEYLETLRLVCTTREGRMAAIEYYKDHKEKENKTDYSTLIDHEHELLSELLAIETQQILLAFENCSREKIPDTSEKNGLFKARLIGFEVTQLLTRANNLLKKSQIDKTGEKIISRLANRVEFLNQACNGLHKDVPLNEMRTLLEAKTFLFLHNNGEKYTTATLINDYLFAINTLSQPVRNNDLFWLAKACKDIFLLQMKSMDGLADNDRKDALKKALKVVFLQTWKKYTDNLNISMDFDAVQANIITPFSELASTLVGTIQDQNNTEPFIQSLEIFLYSDYWRQIPYQHQIRLCFADSIIKSASTISLGVGAKNDLLKICKRLLFEIRTSLDDESYIKSLIICHKDNKNKINLYKADVLLKIAERWQWIFTEAEALPEIRSLSEFANKLLFAIPLEYEILSTDLKLSRIQLFIKAAETAKQNLASSPSILQVKDKIVSGLKEKYANIDPQRWQKIEPDLIKTLSSVLTEFGIPAFNGRPLLQDMALLAKVKNPAIQEVVLDNLIEISKSSQYKNTGITSALYQLKSVMASNYQHPEKAIVFNNNARKYVLDSDQRSSAAIGSMMYQMGRYEYLLGNFDRAEKYYHKAFFTYQYRDKRLFETLGDLAIESGNFIKGASFYFDAAAQAEQANILNYKLLSTLLHSSAGNVRAFNNESCLNLKKDILDSLPESEKLITRSAIQKYTLSRISQTLADEGNLDDAEHLPWLLLKLEMLMMMPPSSQLGKANNNTSAANEFVQAYKMIMNRLSQDKKSRQQEDLYLLNEAVGRLKAIKIRKYYLACQEYNYNVLNSKEKETALKKLLFNYLKLANQLQKKEIGFNKKSLDLIALKFKIVSMTEKLLEIIDWKDGKRNKEKNGGPGNKMEKYFQQDSELIQFISQFVDEVLENNSQNIYGYPTDWLELYRVSKVFLTKQKSKDVLLMANRLFGNSKDETNNQCTVMWPEGMIAMAAEDPDSYMSCLEFIDRDLYGGSFIDVVAELDNKLDNQQKISRSYAKYQQDKWSAFEKSKDKKFEIKVLKNKVKALDFMDQLRAISDTEDLCSETIARDLHISEKMAEDRKRRSPFWLFSNKSNNGERNEKLDQFKVMLSLAQSDSIDNSPFEKTFKSKLADMFVVCFFNDLDIRKDNFKNLIQDKPKAILTDKLKEDLKTSETMQLDFGNVQINLDIFKYYQLVLSDPLINPQRQANYLAQVKIALENKKSNIEIPFRFKLFLVSYLTNWEHPSTRQLNDQEQEIWDLLFPTPENSNSGDDKFQTALKYYVRYVEKNVEKDSNILKGYFQTAGKSYQALTQLLDDLKIAIQYYTTESKYLPEIAKLYARVHPVLVAFKSRQVQKLTFSSSPEMVNEIINFDKYDVLGSKNSLLEALFNNDVNTACEVDENYDLFILNKARRFVKIAEESEESGNTKAMNDALNEAVDCYDEYLAGFGAVDNFFFDPLVYYEAASTSFKIKNYQKCQQYLNVMDEIYPDLSMNSLAMNLLFLANQIKQKAPYNDLLQQRITDTVALAQSFSKENQIIDSYGIFDSLFGAYWHYSDYGNMRLLIKNNIHAALKSVLAADFLLSDFIRKYSVSRSSLYIFSNTINDIIAGKGKHSMPIFKNSSFPETYGFDLSDNERNKLIEKYGNSQYLKRIWAGKLASVGRYRDASQNYAALKISSNYLRDDIGLLFHLLRSVYETANGPEQKRFVKAVAGQDVEQNDGQDQRPESLFYYINWSSQRENLPLHARRMLSYTGAVLSLQTKAYAQLGLRLFESLTNPEEPDSSWFREETDFLRTLLAYDTDWENNRDLFFVTDDDGTTIFSKGIEIEKISQIHADMYRNMQLNILNWSVRRKFIQDNQLFSAWDRVVELQNLFMVTDHVPIIEQFNYRLPAAMFAKNNFYQLTLISNKKNFEEDNISDCLDYFSEFKKRPIQSDVYFYRTGELFQNLGEVSLLKTYLLKNNEDKTLLKKELDKAMAFFLSELEYRQEKLKIPSLYDAYYLANLLDSLYGPLLINPETREITAPYFKKIYTRLEKMTKILVAEQLVYPYLSYVLWGDLATRVGVQGVLCSTVFWDGEKAKWIKEADPVTKIFYFLQFSKLELEMAQKQNELQKMSLSLTGEKFTTEDNVSAKEKTDLFALLGEYKTKMGLWYNGSSFSTVAEYDELFKKLEPALPLVASLLIPPGNKSAKAEAIDDSVKMMPRYEKKDGRDGTSDYRRYTLSGSTKFFLPWRGLQLDLSLSKNETTYLKDHTKTIGNSAMVGLDYKYNDISSLGISFNLDNTDNKENTEYSISYNWQSSPHVPFLSSNISLSSKYHDSSYQQFEESVKGLLLSSTFEVKHLKKELDLSLALEGEKMDDDNIIGHLGIKISNPILKWNDFFTLTGEIGGDYRNSDETEGKSYWTPDGYHKEFVGLTGAFSVGSEGSYQSLSASTGLDNEKSFGSVNLSIKTTNFTIPMFPSISNSLNLDTSYYYTSEYNEISASISFGIMF